MTLTPMILAIMLAIVTLMMMRMRMAMRMTIVVMVMMWLLLRMVVVMVWIRVSRVCGMVFMVECLLQRCRHRVQEMLEDQVNGQKRVLKQDTSRTRCSLQSIPACLTAGIHSGQDWHGKVSDPLELQFLGPCLKALLPFRSMQPGPAFMH